MASGARQVARAASEHVEAPIVDRVVIREITDNQHNIFLKPLERPGPQAAPEDVVCEDLLLEAPFVVGSGLTRSSEPDSRVA